LSHRIHHESSRAAVQFPDRSDAAGAKDSRGSVHPIAAIGRGAS
jgi:hypothetical protein